MKTTVSFRILPRFSSRRRNGFTLIELLVSCAVLVLLVVLVAQMVGSASDTTLRSTKHIDADTEARLVFDRIGRDLAGMLNRPDADVLFSKNTGNDSMFFQSEAPGLNSGGSSPSALSLVGYRITGTDPYTTGYALERLGKRLSWDGRSTGTLAGGPLFLSYSGGNVIPESTIATHWQTAVGTTPDYANGIDDSYHAISPAVCRMEFCFVRNSGSFAALSVTGTGGGLTDMKGIIVGLAILDDTSRKISPDVTKLIAALPDVTAASFPNGTTPSDQAAKLPAAVWRQEILKPDFATNAGLPPSVATNVRVYQRYFPLTSRTQN